MSVNNKVAFISYSHEDKEIAEKVAKDLRKNSIDVWIDKWEINPGDSLIRKIFQEGLANCDIFLIILSASSIKSEWVKEELDYAIIKKIEGVTRIIPLIVGKPEIPAPLKALRWIDLTNNFDDAVREIVKTAYGESEKPPLGRIPAYIRDLKKSIGGLSPHASTIGSILLQGGDETRGDEKQFDGSALRSAATMMNDDEINDAIEELKEYGLVKTIDFLGTAPFNFGLVEPTYALFLHFRNEGLGYDPIEDIKTTASATLAMGEIGGDSLIEMTKLSPLRINRAVDYLEDYGIIKVQKTLGTAPFNFFSIAPTWKTKEFVKNNCK
jgi:hypothetical protein